MIAFELISIPQPTLSLFDMDMKMLDFYTLQYVPSSMTYIYIWLK